MLIFGLGTREVNWSRMSLRSDQLSALPFELSARFEFANGLRGNRTLNLSLTRNVCKLRAVGYGMYR